MKNFLSSIFDGVQVGAEFGLKQAAAAIAKEAGEVGDPVAAFVLSYSSRMILSHGIDGVALARERFEVLLNGDNLDPVKLRDLPLSERAPLLAASTEREISARKAGDAALVAVGAVLGKLAEGFATGAFKTA